MCEKLNYIARSLSKGIRKNYEIYVVNSIFNKLQSFDIEFSTQQTVITKDRKRRYIDMYFPQINLGIEVDEYYHNNNEQKKRDELRELNIKDALSNSLIRGDDIQFERIQISGNQSVDELDKQINNIVKLIKSKVGEKPQWIFDENDRIRQIVDRGYLKRGDSLSGMVSILKVFGKTVKGWQRCTCQCNKPNHFVWSPTLSIEVINEDSVKNTGKQGWINTISEDLSVIFESGVNGKKKTEADAEWDIENNTVRHVFLKYKDALGISKRRFVGSYRCGGYDISKNAETWECFSETCELSKT